MWIVLWLSIAMVTYYCGLVDVKMLNLTEVAIIYLNEPWTCTILIFLVFLLETLGNFLLLSLILFEKFGMDPEKRTIINQLLASICWMLITFNVTCVPFGLARLLTSGLGKPQESFFLIINFLSLSTFQDIFWLFGWLLAFTFVSHIHVAS